GGAGPRGGWGRSGGGLDLGPRGGGGGAVYEPLYSATYPVERRFRLLAPETAYARERGYGWLDAAGVTASPPIRVPYTSLEGDNLDDLALPPRVLYRDWLRGDRTARLRADLPDGEYRITAVVANQPELATGAFQLRALPEGAGAIRYAVGESGDKSMEVRVSGGALVLELVPEAGGNW